MSDPINPYAAPQVSTTMAPGAQWARDLSPSLRQTGLGLALVFYGLVIHLICVVVVMFVVFSAIGARRPVVPTPLMNVAEIGIIVGRILTVIGPLLCLVVPVRSGAKGFIVGSVVFQLAGLAGSIAQEVASKPFPPPAILAIGLLGVVGLVLFILFMKKLSEYIGRNDLADRARNILVASAVLIGLGFVMVGGMAAKMPAFGLLGIVVLIGMLVVLVMYLSLINSLRRALGR